MKKTIVPVTVFPFEASKLEVSDVLVSLDESANIQWALLDNGNKQLTVGRLPVTGQEYDSWGDDDSYLFNLVAEKLNVTVVE